MLADSQRLSAGAEPNGRVIVGSGKVANRQQNYCESCAYGKAPVMDSKST